MPRIPPPPPVEDVVAQEHAYLFAAPGSPFRDHWWAAAACQDAEPEVFFPLGVHDQMSRRIAESYCRRCPVARPCLEVALSDRSLSGIWGGTDEQDRARIRKESPSTRRESLRMITLYESERGAVEPASPPAELSRSST